MYTIDRDQATNQHQLVSQKDQNSSAGIWLRSLEYGAQFTDYEGHSRTITRRLAIDDRGRPFVRAVDISDATDFFDRLFLPPAPLQPPRVYAAGEQVVRPRFKIKLPLVYRCVLKTGLNLLAHSAGKDIALHFAFDAIRAQILDPGADDAIMRACRFVWARPRWLKWLLDSFPPPPWPDEHRMVLDVAWGRVRFRLRLYGSIGYVGYLGRVTRSLARQISRVRVVVDYAGTGIVQVDQWSN